MSKKARELAKAMKVVAEFPEGMEVLVAMLFTEGLDLHEMILNAITRANAEWDAVEADIQADRGGKL